MALLRNLYWPASLLAVAALMGGCKTTGLVHSPEDAAYRKRASAVREAAPLPEAVVPASHAEPAGGAVSPEAASLEVGQPVEVYVDLALAQNPDIQAARKRFEAAAHRVPQAASLKDPMFGVTVFPEPVQTAAGEQEVALMASQHLPWHGKRDTRAQVAAADRSVAWAQLAAVELEVVEQVKRAYYELYFVQKAIEITKQTQQLLRYLEEGLQSEYRTGGVGQHDLLRAQLEVSRLNSDLIRLEQQLESSQAKLARWLHVSPDTPLRALEQPPGEEVPRNLELLYQRAVGARPELQAQLAAMRRDCRKVDLARLNYFPDMTAGVTWIGTSASGLSPVANGRDPVLLGLSINVPLYHKRLDAGVREAEARACSSARVYDSLRDRTTEEVKDLFVQATSQQELIELFRDEIIPKADQTLQVSRSAYKVGSVDFLQLIDNWQQLLRFQIAQHRLESQLLQTLAKLERVVGGQLEPEIPAEMTPIPPGPEPPALVEPLPDTFER
jgi:cobalt-zinc-cadmium efflux system outer membrane protein